MNSRFQFHRTPLAGLAVIERLPIADQRGFLERLFCATAFSELGLNKPIAQINHTYTRHRGTVRGMHFQIPPYAETKIISCLRGEVFDVAVDLRAASPTFMSWHGEILSAKNKKSLCIPEGYAHGFQTLNDDCEMLYCHTAPYHAEAEGGISPLERRLGIAWPLSISDMSDRDRAHPQLAEDYPGIKL